MQKRLITWLVLGAILLLMGWPAGRPSIAQEDAYPLEANDAASLIAAINQANLNPDPDTIILSADIDLLTVFDPLEGPLALPTIFSQLVIEGNGHTIRRGDGSADWAACDGSAPADFRFFVVRVSGPRRGDLTLRDLTLANGCARPLEESAGAGDAGAFAGAIFVHEKGRLRLENCTLRDNRALVAAGAVLVEVFGELTLQNTALLNNRAPFGGGIASYGGEVVVLAGSQLHGNQAEQGGAIFSERGGVMRLATGVEIGDNVADFGGGLAIFRSRLVVDGAQISGNWGRQAGGGLYNGAGSVVSLGPGTVMAHNKADHGGAISNNGATVRAEEVLVTKNTADYGGAVTNNPDSVFLAEGRSVFSHNDALLGGAFLNFDGGQLMINAAYLGGNRADEGGSVIFSEASAVYAVRVMESCLSNNGPQAIVNTAEAMQSASGNWWGASDGPGGDGPGSGDGIVGAVAHDGYLANCPLDD